MKISYDASNKTQQLDNFKTPVLKKILISPEALAQVLGIKGEIKFVGKAVHQKDYTVEYVEFSL
jgi:hypothetical protein